MRFRKFITIIENNSLVIAKKWAKGVSQSRYTKTYRKLPEEELIQIGKRVYDNLGQWLHPETTQSAIGTIYADIGAERYEQGFPLCEISYAVHYTKKVLMNYILTESVMPDTLTLYQLQGFITLISDFFDLAAFYLTRGFQEALYKKIAAQKGVGKKELENIFPVGSFYYEMEPDFRAFEKALEGFNLFKVK